MTTVVIDFANRKIVADKQTTSKHFEKRGVLGILGAVEPKLADWSFSTRETCKIHRLEDGRYFVGAGDKSELIRQKDHYNAYGYIDKPKESVTIALVNRKGDGLFVDLYNSEKKRFGKYVWEKIYQQGTAELITFGSGGDYAYGAFKAGVSAEEAVVAASKCDKYTSAEYDVEEL